MKTALIPRSLLAVILLSCTSVLGATSLQIRINQPGLMVLEARLDSVWIDKRGEIHTHPALSRYPRSGYPSLPCFQELLLDLPPGAVVQVFTDPSLTIPASGPRLTPPEQAKGLDLILTGDTWNGGLYPPSPARLSGAGSLRGRPMQNLAVFPVRVTAGTLSWHRSLSVRITWNPRGSGTPQLLSRLKTLPPPTPGRQARRKTTLPAYQFSPHLARIVVDTTGWYTLTRRTLVDSSLNLTGTDPRSFRLWNGSRELPLWVEGEDDGIFNTGDRIIFRGQPAQPPAGATYRNNFYTRQNVYWLSWGGEAGLRYSPESAYPGLPEDQVLRPVSYRYSVHTERDEYFARLGNMQTHARWDRFDHFFMNPPIHGGTSRTFILDLLYPRPTNTSSFQVSLEFQGITSNQHNLQAFLNGYQVCTATWTGQSPRLVTQDPNQVLLNNFLTHGPNQLMITLAGNDATNRYDQVYLNWVEVTYERLYRAWQDQISFHRDGDITVPTQFEITGFSSPLVYVFKQDLSRLRDFMVLPDPQTGTYTIILQDVVAGPQTRYHAFTADRLRPVISLHPVDPVVTPLNQLGGEYLVIRPDSFAAVLEPLLDYHNGIGIDIDDIYRQYSGGILNPDAIRDFLQEAWQYWSPRPRWVLIAQQGGRFTWSGTPGTHGNYIPAMKIQTVGWGAASADFWYSLVEGDDLIPEFAIGRLPARNRTELETMVSKTLALLQSSGYNWHNQVLLIGGYEQTFKEQSETMLATILEEGYFPQRLYIDRYSEGGPFFGSTDTLLNRINRGLAYINFLGHGGGAVWGDRSLLTLSDLEQLHNGARTPFVTSMTCFTGNVTNPNSLGRRMVTLADGGAAAWFGSAGVGWIINDFLLLQPLYQALFRFPEQSLGELITRAKIEYLTTNTYYPDIAISQVYQFNLTGDPALHLPVAVPALLNVNPADPQAGETLQLLTGDPAADSLRVQLFDPGRIPLTHRPETLVTDAAGRADLSLPDTLSPGNYTLAAGFQSHNTLYRASLALPVAGSLGLIEALDPAEPTEVDSLQIVVLARDRQGVDSVWLLIHGQATVGLAPLGDDRYSHSPRLPPLPAGTYRLSCRIRDMAGILTQGPETTLTVHYLPDFEPRSLELAAGRSLDLIAAVRNHTTGRGQARVRFQRRETAAWQTLGSDTLEFAGTGTLQARQTLAAPPGTHSYRVLTDGRQLIRSLHNDTLQADLETRAFWVTPALGTTPDLLTHSRVQVGNIGIEIPPGIVSAAAPLAVSGLETVERPHQPAFAVVPLDTLYPGLQLSFPEDIRFSGTWELTAPPPDSVTLYRYYPDYQVWLPETELSGLPGGVEFSSLLPGRWAWLHTRDVQAPAVEVTVNGQRFLNHSYMNTAPVLTIIARDDNGLDHRPAALRVWLNGLQLDPPPLGLVSGSAGQLGLRLTPHLTPADSSLGVQIQDASGNVSDTLSLKFIVREKLELIDYGNFPNPFTDQTRFAYELTETVDKFRLDLFTVDGRRIRRFTPGATLTDLDPRLGAYHEIIWDGRNEQGDFVANGVYFYLLRVSKGKTVLERRGKVAKAR